MLSSNFDILRLCTIWSCKIYTIISYFIIYIFSMDPIANFFSFHLKPPSPSIPPAKIETHIFRKTPKPSSAFNMMYIFSTKPYFFVVPPAASQNIIPISLPPLNINWLLSYITKFSCHMLLLHPNNTPWQTRGVDPKLSSATLRPVVMETQFV